MSASWEVQEALYDELKGDSTFMALIDGIFDEPPTNQVQNYVVLGDTIENRDDNHSTLGFETYITFVIYTKPAGLGFYTAKKILERMNTLLNTKRFTLSTLRMLLCEYDNHSTFRKDDIRGIRVRYKVLTAQTSQFTI